LDIKKKYEIWSIVGSKPVTNELARFWEMVGGDIDAGPSSKQIITSCKRCGEWSRDDRMRLGYLAIYIGYVEGKKYSSATRASHARLMMDLEELETYPWGRLAFKFMMDSMKGKDITRSYTIDGFIQVLKVWVYFALSDFARNFGKPIMVNYVVKEEIGEMFPQWDNDLTHAAVENLVNFMFHAKSNWKVKKEEIKQMFKDMTKVMTDGFEQCVKKMKLLADTMGWKLWRRSCIKELSFVIMDKQKSTKSDLEKEKERRHIKKDVVMTMCYGKSDKERKLSTSHQFSFQGNNTAKLIIPTKKVGHGYNPFAPVDKKKTKLLFSKNPEHFRTDRLCLLYHLFRRMWTRKYEKFKSPESGLNGLGRNLHAGSWDLYAGLLPKYCQTKKIWGLELEPFTTIIPYLLVEYATSDKERVKYTLNPFTYERVRAREPLARSGDCGVYALKYIECHALGMPSFPSAFCEKNTKVIREKLATEIFDHALGYQGAEIEDYEGLDMYD
ncbi:hypothetical protein N665_0038s0039, partial [Sinapis alba]